MSLPSLKMFGDVDNKSLPETHSGKTVRTIFQAELKDIKKMT